MKKVINGKMYNTETAEQLATWDNGRWNSFDICEEKLFRKRNGEFFLYGYGGPKSAYAQPDGDRRPILKAVLYPEHVPYSLSCPSSRTRTHTYHISTPTI